jgi:hypothetical protein
MSAVRRTFDFLQYGTSARLAEPPDSHARARALLRKGRITATMFLSHDTWVRINGTLKSLEESSLRRVRFRAIGIRTGWSEKPFEPRQWEFAEGHRVRRRSIQALRTFQGARQQN